MADVVPDHVPAKKTEWLSQTESKASDHDKNLWESAYAKVHEQNHYMKGEGNYQALARLKKQGYLNDLPVDGISKEAGKKSKEDLGKNGKLHRKFYTTKDHVLDGDQEQKEVGTLVEHQKKHEQAERLSPTSEQIKQALTPDIQDQLKKAGLNVDGDKLHDQIAKRLETDKGLPSAVMEKMKQSPVGAPYVAMGAVTGQQMDAVLKEQKDLRDNWKNANPNAQMPDDFKHQTDLGGLLRKHAQEDPQHYSIAKLDAADALIKKLLVTQGHQGSQK